MPDSSHPHSIQKAEIGRSPVTDLVRAKRSHLPLIKILRALRIGSRSCIAWFIPNIYARRSDLKARDQLQIRAIAESQSRALPRSLIPAASDINSLQPGPGSFTTLISCKMSAERRQSGSLCLVPSFAFCLTSQRCSSADTDPAVHLYTQSKPPGLTEYRFPCTFVGRSPSVLRLWGSAVHRHFHTV